MGVGFKGTIAATVLVIGIVGAQPRADAVKISGRVEDRLPEPLVNITVLLRVGESRNEVSKTQTDNAGRFEFAGVPPNSYEVVLQVPGFKSQTVPVSATKIDVDVGTVVLDVAVAVFEDPVAVEDPIAVSFTGPGGASEAHADGPIMTTLCDLTKSPMRFHGQMVKVHADVAPPTIDSGLALYDLHCSAWINISLGSTPSRADSKANSSANDLFHRYVSENRPFDATLTGRFLMQLMLAGQAVFYITLPDISDVVLKSAPSSKARGLH